MKRTQIYILIVIALVSLLGWLGRVSAQDAGQVVLCQDVSYGVGSFVFHIPASWNNPDIASWWVLADGFGAYSDPSDGVTFRADWLTNYTDILGEGFPTWEQNIKNGQVLIGSGDYSTIAVGDANTPACDSNGYPVAPSTPAYTPDQCPAWASVEGSDQKVCLWSLPAPTS